MNKKKNYNKSKNYNKDYNKNYKRNNNKSYSVLSGLLSGFFALMVMGGVKAIMKEHFSNKKADFIKDSYKSFEKKLDNLTPKEFNDLVEKHKFNNDELSLVSVPLGFFQMSDTIFDYCENSGYIPMKFIKKIDSYKKPYNLKEDFINYQIKQGLTYKQAELIYSENMNLLKKQVLKSLNNEYIELKKNHSQITIKGQCQLYDELGDEIIKEKIEDIKKKSPRVYNKFFSYTYK